MNNNLFKNLAVWLLIGFLVFLIVDFYQGSKPNQPTQPLSYSNFLTEVKNGNVSRVEIRGNNIKGELNNGSIFTTYSPNDQGLISRLEKSSVEIIALPLENNSPGLLDILISWFPMLLLIGVWIFFMRQMQSGSGRAMGFGRSRAKLLNENKNKVTFKDVAGIDEAKAELEEIVEFLKDPTKFQRLGGKIPKGALLVGPPGTGKTLLARAIAGEANVPFFSISGSDFVEMFVGVGASRVRDMFDQAKKQSPCIVFIDEIDAVGRHRGTGLGGGHDEREQTLNQLLVEMDRFEGNDGVLVIAATNRPDVLDPALLRPGRFDRQVVVDLPDIRGREAILKVHMRKVPLAADVDPLVIARGTPGFSGADLANLINEAALFAARYSDKKIDQSHLDLAKDKIMMGAERKSMILSEEQKRITAYHEAGHAIVGRLCPTHDPVYKVTIIPRGRALGVTMFLPEEDTYMQSKEYLLGRIATLFGGRIAESIINGHDGITTGASNDIEVATGIATNMVTKWGFSDALGTIKYGEDEGSPFLGRTASNPAQIRSDQTSKLIDSEVKAIIDSSYKRAEKLLKENLDKLNVMAEALLKYETIDAPQIDDIMAGATPREPKGWSDDSPQGKSSKKTSIKGAAEEL